MYFLPPRDLNLPRPAIDLEVEKQGSGAVISVSSANLAKNIYFTTGVDGFFSDNYFDLLPGETRTVTFEPEEQSLNDSLQINIITLVDSY